jgi:cytochrome c biogenesis protein
MKGRVAGDSSSSEEKGSIISDIAAFFTSARTTIVLLFLLAAGSILGTLVPQTQEIGPVTSFSSRLIVILDLNNVYRSWWFILLLVLLSLNLLGCLMERLPAIPGEWKGKSRRSTFSVKLTDTRSPAKLAEILLPKLNAFMNRQPERSAERDEFVWIKDRIYLLGFPLIHIAILVVLLGGVIGVFFGYRGHVLIKEGASAQEFSLSSGETRPLPFTISVDAFSLTRYPSGEPKEFRSDVKIVENGKEVRSGSILVNHPLTYKGISLFQSDYRVVGVKEVRLTVIGSDSNKTDVLLRPQSSQTIPGTDYEARLTSLDPGTTQRGAGVDLMVNLKGENPRPLRIFKKSGPVKLGEVQLAFVDYSPLYATGLQVGYDPGTLVVWIGCGLLIIGFFLTLFTNFRRITMTLTKEGTHTAVRVSCRSRSMRKEFRKSVEEIVQQSLQSHTPQTKHK